MKVKVCGITDEKEADYLDGVDFAGFVLFFPKSKRNISIEKAESIIRHIKGGIKKTAVVVKPTLEQIKAIDRSVFDYVQIHGEILPEVLEEVKTPILKAFNVSDINEIGKYDKNDKIVGYVFDSQVPGSGKTFDWSLIENIPKDGKIFIIAGGLNCENVKDIPDIADAVDVSSGVENDDGKGKSREKIRIFVKNAKSL